MAGGAVTPDPHPDKALMNVLFFAEQSPFLRRRVGGAENSMRLIAEGLAARGHAVAFASLRPDPLPFPRRFAVNGVDVLLCPNPRRVARSAGSPRQARPRAAPARRPGALGPGRRAGARAGGGRTGGRPLRLLRDGVPRRGAAARGRRARPGMAIVMRMAGLGWADALVRDGGDPAAEHPPSSTRSTRSTTSPRARARWSRRRRPRLGQPLAPRSSFVADIGVDVGRVPLSWAGPSAGPGLDLVVATRFAAPQKRQDLLIEAVGLLKDRLPVRSP